MASFLNESVYKDGNYPYPSSYIDPALKGEEWHRRHNEALFSAWVNDQTAISYSKRDDIVTNRLFAAGMQPVDQYMDWMGCEKDKNTGERKGLMNISWDIFAIGPKFKKIAVEHLKKIKYNITCSDVSKASIDEKENQKWDIWCDKILKLANVVDQDPDKKDAGIEKDISSIEELEMYQSIGGMKNRDEVAIEKFLRHSFDISNWDQIEDDVYGDLYENDIGAVCEFSDPDTGKLMAKYLDIFYLAVRYSKDKEFSNIDRWGYVDFKTIEQVRSEAIVSGQPLKEETLFDIARKSQAFYGNVTSIRLDPNFSQYYQDNNYTYQYDNFKVPVFMSEWFDTNVKKTKIKTTEDGEEKRFPAAFDYTLKKKGEVPKGQENGPSTRVEQTDIQIVRKCKWVVGTSITYNWGLQDDIPRPEKNRAALSLHAYKTGDRSMQASIIPMLNAIQLSWLNIQNGKATAPPPGMAMDFKALSNIILDGIKDASPLELESIRRQTGTLWYSSQGHYSERSSGYPFSPIPSMLDQYIKPFWEDLSNNINIIGEITGINKIADASTPDPNQPVQNSKFALQATSKALAGFYFAMKSIKQRVADNFVNRLKVIAKHRDIEFYSDAIGEGSVEMFKITKNISNKQLGIRLEELPNDEMKADIKDKAFKATALKLEEGGIEYMDYLDIVERLDNGSMKEAKFLLGLKQRKAKAKAAEKMKQESAMRIQETQAQQASIAQAYKARSEADKDKEIALQKEKNAGKLAEETLRHKNKMEELQFQAQTMTGNTMLKNQSQEKIHTEKHDTQKDIAHAAEVSDLLQKHSQPAAQV